MKKNFITLESSSSNEIQELLKAASVLKQKKGQILNIIAGKSVGLIFQKPSNRTRVSFEVGVHQLGGNCLYLGPQEINLGKRESTADVAKTLSRYLDCIVARTFSHKTVLELSAAADIPVINGLSDRYHPCQALTDILTVQENFPGRQDLTLTYIGDGNNVCNSLLFAIAMLCIFFF